MIAELADALSRTTDAKLEAKILQLFYDLTYQDQVLCYLCYTMGVHEALCTVQCTRRVMFLGKECLEAREIHFTQQRRERMQSAQLFVNYTLISIANICTQGDGGECPQNLEMLLDQCFANWQGLGSVGIL